MEFTQTFLNSSLEELIKLRILLDPLLPRRILEIATNLKHVLKVVKGEDSSTFVDDKER